MAEHVDRTFATSLRGVASLAVDGRLTRTTALHGITGDELKRLDASVSFMALYCQRGRSELMWLTTSKGTSRSAIADTWKRVTRLQKQFELPSYSTAVFETRGGAHAHIVFIGMREIANRLRAAKFGEFVKVDRVHDVAGLVRKYLAKERSPQAGFRRSHRYGGRIKGSHRLEGGGDRVRLSRDLERDAIDAGAIEPWQHTNAKRSTGRKPYRLRKLSSRKSLNLSGQLSLLPEFGRPISRLKDFGGGVMPRAVARETEFLRRRRGWTQAELGFRIGMHQPHVANVLRGHDRISQFAANRLRDALLEGIPHDFRC